MESCKGTVCLVLRVDMAVRLLSLDMGPVNLGLTEVEVPVASKDYRQFRILRWERMRVSQTKCTIAETVCQLLVVFRDLFPVWPPGVHHVLVERQPAANPRCVIMSYALYAFFLNLWAAREGVGDSPVAPAPWATAVKQALDADGATPELSQAVVFVDPYRKNMLARTFNTGVRMADYASRTRYNKVLVMTACKLLLADRPADMQRWTVASKKKLDDLADSLFQALVFYHETMCGSLDSDPARRVALLEQRPELQFPSRPAKRKRPKQSKEQADKQQQAKRKRKAAQGEDPGLPVVR
jgi:hypothetical protein